MKVLPIDKIRNGMYLAQNIYRHDGLLALPVGAMLTQVEVQMLRNMNIDFLLVGEDFKRIGRRNDIHFTLKIIEASYKNSMLWDREFGNKLYDYIESKIIKNKKVQFYLNELRFVDSYSFTDSINISIIIAKILAIDEEMDKNLAYITLLSLLHDVGKIKTDIKINKDDTLTEEEFKEIRKIPAHSYNLLLKAGFADYEIKFVLETHERWDGTGYPSRLKKEEISELAQLILLANEYNEVSTCKPYQKKNDLYEVIEKIKENKEKSVGKRFVELFLDKFVPFKVGYKIELNTGQIGVIEKINDSDKIKPVIRIVSEKIGDTDETIDLSKEKYLKIKKIL